MWEDPIYKFQKKIFDVKGNSKNLEITINVTRSAPTMSKPGDQLEGVFRTLTRNKSPEKTKILDVGAAKLRNTLYLLKKGFQVYSVEFEELFKEKKPKGKKKKKKKQSEINLEKAHKFSNFKELVFPKEFFRLKEKMDIALLINVTNVMPIPEERLVLLSLCREKLKENGILLWYNWRDIKSNPKSYPEDRKLNDGYFKGIYKEKTFHSEWLKDHVNEMLIATGFSRDKEIKLSDYGTNQAFVFKSDQDILLENYLDLAIIKKGGKKREPKVIMPETGGLYFPSIYVSELKKTPAGRGDFKKFHRLSARLLATIFDHQLKNPVVENEINKKKGFIDIKFNNKNEPGFFKNLKDLRDVKCPSIFAECKNYHYDLENPDFAQLSSRLNKFRGMFGFLVCRKINKREKMIENCNNILLKEEKYVIVLDDNDMETMAYLKKDEGTDALDDYLENRVEEIEENKIIKT